jgi:hypothetical protein
MTGSADELSHAYITAINISLQARPYRFREPLPFGVGSDIHGDNDEDLV